VRLPLALLMLASVLAACSPKSAKSTGRSVPINITVTCTANSITFSVDHWTQHLSEGDEVTWSLTAESNTPEVKLKEDPPGGRWPFHDGPPLVRPGSPGHAGNMKQGLGHGFTSHYSLNAVCQVPGGPKIKGTIDPDMIVD
jgi:hypothetical protein